MTTTTTPEGTAPGPDPQPHGIADALIALEYALVAAHHACQNWKASAMHLGGQEGLAALDIAILLELGRATRPASFGDLCRSTRVEQPHLAHYALRKLRGRGLILMTRRGKEKIVELTLMGQKLHRDVTACRGRIAAAAGGMPLTPAQLGGLAQALHQVTQLYDQARRQTAP